MVSWLVSQSVSQSVIVIQSVG